MSLAQKVAERMRTTVRSLLLLNPDLESQLLPGFMNMRLFVLNCKDLPLEYFICSECGFCWQVKVLAKFWHMEQSFVLLRAHWVMESIHLMNLSSPDIADRQIHTLTKRTVKAVSFFIPLHVARSNIESSKSQLSSPAGDPMPAHCLDKYGLFTTCFRLSWSKK